MLPCDCCRQPTDVEVFNFTAGAPGLATIGLSGASKMGSVVRSNLNTNLTLTGPTGTALTSQAGVGIYPFSVSLPSAGTYTVSLTPVGVGDPKTVGYSAYGSRGQVGVFGGDACQHWTLLNPAPAVNPAKPCSCSEQCWTLLLQ